MKFDIGDPVHLDGETAMRSVAARRVSIAGAGGFDYRLLPASMSDWIHGSRLKLAKGFGSKSDPYVNPFSDAMA